MVFLEYLLTKLIEMFTGIYFLITEAILLLGLLKNKYLKKPKRNNVVNSFQML